MFKKLDGVTGDTSNVRSSCALEYIAFVTGKEEEIGEAGDRFNELLKDFHAQCEKIGLSLIRTNAGIRPMTQEEILSVVPRKFHLVGTGGSQACSTPFVSPKYLTRDATKVTCKLCKQKLDGNR